MAELPNYFIQYQAMRLTNTTEPYWDDRWTVADKHPAHFIDDLEKYSSETNSPPGNIQKWRYRIIFACEYHGEFNKEKTNANDES